MRSTMMRDGLSLNDLLERAGRLHGESVIVSRLPDKSLKRHSFAEYYKRTRKLAAALLAGPIVPALVEAFDAFARKDYAKAIALIEPHMAEHERIGGSRAQRRLIELTLAAARKLN